MLISNV